MVDEDNIYTKVLDGNGYTIKNLNASLIGELYGGGTVKNLTLDGIQIDNKFESRTGGVCLVNKGIIDNCSIENSKIEGAEYVGGFCQENSGKIRNCSVENTTITGKNVGGICAENNMNGEIVSSTVENNWIDGDYVGGICVENSDSKIVKSTVSNVDLINETVEVGGIAYDNVKGSTIINCTVGSIKAQKIGVIAFSNENADIRNCISNDEKYLTRYNSGLIESCISVEKEHTKKNFDRGEIESCFIVSEDKSEKECTGDVHTVSTINEAKTLSLF